MVSRNAAVSRRALPRLRAAGMTLLLLLGALLPGACATEVSLFERRGDEDAPSSSGGGASNAGSSNQGGANPTSGSEPGDGRSDALRSVVGLRVVVLEKVEGSLGVQFRTLSFGLSDGTNFPPTNAAARAALEFEQTPFNDSEPVLAFDGDSETWWELRLTPQEGFVGVRMDTPLSARLTTLFVDLHQQQYRAPTSFDVLAFDGERWWSVLEVRDLVWPEEDDLADWERNQRVFSLPPPREWLAKD